MAAVSAGVAVLLCLVAGLAALAQDLGVSLSMALHESSRGGTAGIRVRFARRAIVAAEIGLAFALLVSTGALYTRFRNLLNVDPGFNARTIGLFRPARRGPGIATRRILLHSSIASPKACARSPAPPSPESRRASPLAARTTIPSSLPKAIK